MLFPSGPPQTHPCSVITLPPSSILSLGLGNSGFPLKLYVSSDPLRSVLCPVPGTRLLLLFLTCFLVDSEFGEGTPNSPGASVLLGTWWAVNPSCRMNSQHSHFQSRLLDLLAMCHAGLLEIAGVGEVCLKWQKELTVQVWIELWGLRYGRCLHPEAALGAREGL